MDEILVLPLKKPVQVEVVKPLRNIIDSRYSNAYIPSDYIEAVKAFNDLRNRAIWRPFDKHEGALEIIYS